MADRGGTMRIGELARRTGMAEATLRAWERRYGIPRPQRTEGGHRLYSEADVDRLARIRRLVELGWAVGPAARRVGEEHLGPPDAPAAPPELDASRVLADFDAALGAYDERGARRVLSRAIDALGVLRFADEIVPAALERVGSDAREHAAAAVRAFGRQVLRGRLLTLLDDLDAPPVRGLCVTGSVAERIGAELVQLAGAAALAGSGWTVRNLGTGVAPPTLAAAAEATGADVVLLAGDATLDRHDVDGLRQAHRRLVLLSEPAPTAPAGTPTDEDGLLRAAPGHLSALVDQLLR